MLTKEDIEYISNIIEKSFNYEKKKPEIKYEYRIKEFRISDNINCDYNVSYIDSSYIHGVVGPVAYIYSRAVKVSNDRISSDKIFLILNDSFFGIKDKSGYDDKVTLQDLAELISKYLEYKIAFENKSDYTIIDGSLIADYILAVKYRTFYSKDIDIIHKEYRDNFKKLLKDSSLSIAKRIIQAHIISKDPNDHDIFLLQQHFDNVEFFSGPYYVDLREDVEFLNIKIGSIYFRPRKGDHIYRLEFSDSLELDEVVCIIYKEIYKRRRYPFGLKLAHYKSKITNKEKMIIEDIIKRQIGIDKTIGWETK